MKRLVSFLMIFVLLTGILTLFNSPIEFASLSFNQFRTHQFQKLTEDLVAKKLRFRNFLISINSQLYYSLFKKTFAEDSQIIVGKQHQLYELSYITAYCQPKIPDHLALVRWANNIKQLSDYFEGRGKTFIYLVTPSKAEFVSEAIPDRFHCQTKGPSPQLATIESLLKERHIRFINTSSLLAKSNTPVFPQGGIHWNWLGTAMGANAVINAINQDGHYHLQSLHYTYSMQKPRHEDSDDDLLSLIKLLKPNLNYPVPQVQFTKLPATQPLKLAIIGGSFNENLIKVFLRNNLFKEINFYFYFNTLKKYSAAKNEPTVSPITKDYAPILTADIIILEENASISFADHTNRFSEAMRQVIQHGHIH